MIIRNSKISKNFNIKNLNYNLLNFGTCSKAMTVGATFKNKSAADDSVQHTGDLAAEGLALKISKIMNKAL